MFDNTAQKHIIQKIRKYQFFENVILIRNYQIKKHSTTLYLIII